MRLSVVHLDADAFFAAVEQAADPRLRGKPVAVGGERRGIIASASYEARRLGIYTPMPTVRARRLCPQLILLPGDYEKYERFSRWMFSYAYDFTPDVEICSIDEGYLDLTGVGRSPIDVAATIRQAIRDSLKISVSEGIGTNKLVSQIASKLHKPAAFEYVPPGQEQAFLHPLPNHWLPGVGPVLAERFNAAGLTLIRQVAATPIERLSLLVGRSAPLLHRFANGVDPRPVIPVSEPAKSYGHQETFAQDQTDETYLTAVLRRMADQLFAQARADGKSVRTLTVKVRYNDMDEEQVGESLSEPTDLEADIYGRLPHLLKRAWRRRVSVRLVSLRLSNLYAGAAPANLPLDRADQQHHARRRLADIVDQLRQQHGATILLRGHDFILREGEPAPKAPEPSLTPESQLPRFGSAPLGRGTHGEQRTASPLSGATPPAQSTPGTRRHQSALALVRSRSAEVFLPLVVRSHYSFLNSTLSIPAILALAREHGLPALALCDQHNLHGAVEFAVGAQAAGIKPVLGAEVRGGHDPLYLYVQDQPGYANLCRILSQPLEAEGKRGWKPGARSSLESQSLVSALGDTAGLLAVSADPGYAAWFPGRFYRAITNRAALRRYDPGEGGLPAVPLLPVHYAIPADRWKFDLVQSIRTLTLLRQEHPDKLSRGRYHFWSPGEMGDLFGRHPELLAHTREIADRCTFTGRIGKPQFPAFRPPDGSTPAGFLRQLVLDGLRRRYGGQGACTPQGTRLTPDDLRHQVQEELNIIHAVGYEEYFLGVWDLLQTCRRRGIEWITRGSAADSLVCYCLGISDVCPIRFELYFRRFLNLERMALHKLPDIDIDFPHDRKDDVIDLIFARYGPEHAAVVGGFSTFQTRSAFAEVAKVLGVAERDVRRFTEHFPWSFGGGWETRDGSFVPDGIKADGSQAKPEGRLIRLLMASPECRDLPLQEEPYRSALVMAELLNGVPRYPKMHPCGVVVSREPMHALTPTFISPKGYPTTHFDMDAVEAIGLVKMDILAQGGLAVMRDVKTALRERGLALDLDRLTVASVPDISVASSHPPSAPNGPVPLTPLGSGRSQAAPLTSWNDPAVWESIASGGARAVHHIESPAMTSLCRMCDVRDIDTLIAIVSVIRPGAANEDKKREFARRYQGLSPVSYVHPTLTACLRSTFGLVVYEEHILQICEAFAGLAPGRADILRRALVKEKMDVVQEIRSEFVASARQCGRTEEEILQVWQLVAGFHGYAFCKAHSTAYGIEAYQSAWLKRYYPAEFMAAVLSNGKGFYRPLVYVLECHRLGISLLPPWVNEPGPAFRAVDATTASPRIRVPVTAIQSLTETTRDKILTERNHAPFSSLADFFLRVHPAAAEMETLCRAGAFDGFGRTRCEQFWEIQHWQAHWGHTATAGQGWLIPPPGLRETQDQWSMTLTEPTRLQRLRWEMELLGFPASGHPLELYPQVAWETYCPVSRVGEFLGQEITLCGFIIEDRVHHQVTGEPMKFLTLADWTGMIEAELFARTYKTYGLTTVRYPVLEVTARVEPFENGRGHTLRVLHAGKPRDRSKPG